MSEGHKFVPLKLAIVIVAGLCALLYAADFVSLRIGVPAREKLGSISVHTYYAVKLKNGRTEYDNGSDEVVNCSNSLFPQLGVSPCWYIERHPNQQITIDSGDPNNPRIF
jgi:hypothetical protein